MIRIMLFFIFLNIQPVKAEPIQIKKPVLCETTFLVFQSLLEIAGEKPIWLGRGNGVDTSSTAIFANKNTKSWTIVQFDEDSACILGSGISSREIFTGPEI